MNRNLLIVLGGGFLIAVLVAMMVQASLSGQKKEEPVKEEARVQIIVAAKPLSVGTELDETNIKWQEWPKSAVFPGAVVRGEGEKDKDKKPTEALSGTIRRAVAEGEPVTRAALVSARSATFLPAIIGEGMRAVAISVNAEKTAGGFVAPGDYVDVILTYKKKIKYNDDTDSAVGTEVKNMIQLNLEKMAVETILQNVKVLAIDQTPKPSDDPKPSATSADSKEEGKSKDKPKSKEKTNKIAKTVTLEVDPKGAEMLALGDSMGELSLSLRKLGDGEYYVRDYAVITDERMTNVTDEIYNEVQRIENASGQNTNIVRIYNGGSVTAIPVGQ